MDGGDHFEAFVRRFQDMVYAVALRLLGEPADAEDVAQMVFLRAYRDFAMLRTNPAAPGWLKTTATNLSLNHLTRHRARWHLFSEVEGEEESGEGGIPSSLEPGSDGGHDSLEVSGDAERFAEVEAALQRLPDHQRVPLVLYHFEEKSLQEISEMLGVSLGKVKTDMHRGRLAIRKVLGVAERMDSAGRGPQ